MSTLRFPQKSHKWTPERKAAWSTYQRTRKLTVEQREKMSIAQRKSVALGRHASRNPEFVKNVASKNRGRHHSEETKRKMAEAQQAVLARGGNNGPEHFEKLSQLHKGKPFSGKTYDHSGRKQTLDERMRRRESARRGAQHHAWAGGLSSQRSNDVKYVEWRMRVFFRDGFQCKGESCPIPATTYLTAHHIKPWAKYPELRYEVDNGITLCEVCHAKVDPWYRRMNKVTILSLARKSVELSQTEGVTSVNR